MSYLLSVLKAIIQGRVGSHFQQLVMQLSQRGMIS